MTTVTEPVACQTSQTTQMFGLLLMDRTLQAGQSEGQTLLDPTLSKHLQENYAEIEVNSMSNLPLQQRPNQLQQTAVVL